MQALPTAQELQLVTSTTQKEVAGITPAGQSLNGECWNISGQIYRPVQLSETSFSFETIFPPGTFVPPHYHADQDEYIRIAEGEFAVWLDGQELTAKAGDIIRMPMGSKHGITNKTSQDVRAMFWASPSLRLYEYFSQIDGLVEPEQIIRIAASHNIHFLPPPAL